jgi:hypothetical protein
MQVKNAVAIAGLLLLLMAVTISVIDAPPDGGKTPTQEAVDINQPGMPVQTGGVWQVQNAGVWQVIDPHDPAQPEIFLRDDSGYYLDPDWQIAKIEYLYRWGGLGVPQFDYRIVEDIGDSYLGDSERPVAPDDVTAFVESIRHLHPTQAMVGGYMGTDSYPSWAIEIAGMDGGVVSISSNSTGNAGAGPWNVYYNGRLYAQYDGSLYGPMTRVFGLREPSETYLTSQDLADVVFGTRGDPLHLSRGFSGLMPLSSGFSYSADSEANQIRGVIIGRESFGIMGGTVIGPLTDLTGVILTSADGTATSCVIEARTSRGYISVWWDFTCHLDHHEAGEQFQYVIEASGTRESGDELITRGKLFGLWDGDEAFYLLPRAEELTSALAKNDSIQRLFESHPLWFANYQARLSTETPQSGIMAGEIIVLGETEVDGKPVKYTFGSEFMVEDGNLTRWGLTSDKMDALVEFISTHPLTARAVAADPDLMLNIWYAEEGREAEAPYDSAFGGVSPYHFQVAPCGDLPGIALPSTDHPFIAFGFSSGETYRNAGTYYEPDFVLVDSEVYVGIIDIDPENQSRGATTDVLIPDIFDTGEEPPFERILMLSGSSYGMNAEIRLNLNSTNLSREELQDYVTQLESLPFMTRDTNAGEWAAENVKLRVDATGTIKVSSCNDQG